MSGIFQFKSTDLGAPTLSNAGTMIGLMDAIRNGYGSVAVVSLTRSGDVVTVETSSAHGLQALAVAEISGAAETAYNGQWPVATVPDSTHYTYNIGAATPASPATGTISSKRAGIGWPKPFAGTNKAGYRMPTTAPSTGMYLRLDDSDANYASVAGFETMSDVDNGTGRFPLVGSTSIWRRNSSGARPWAAYSDGLMLWLFIRWHGSTYANEHAPLGFGDLIPTSGLDTYHCMLLSESFDSTTGPYNNTDFPFLASDFNGTAKNSMHLPRGYSQVGSAVRACMVSLGGVSSLASYAMAYPAPHDNGLYLMPLFVGQGGICRGRLPGMLALPHGATSQTTNINHYDRFNNVAGLPGRTVEMVRIPGNSSASDVFVAIDITGPWR